MDVDRNIWQVKNQAARAAVKLWRGNREIALIKLLKAAGGGGMRMEEKKLSIRRRFWKPGEARWVHYWPIIQGLWRAGGEEGNQRRATMQEGLDSQKVSFV